MSKVTFYIRKRAEHKLEYAGSIEVDVKTKHLLHPVINEVRKMLQGQSDQDHGIAKNEIVYFVEPDIQIDNSVPRSMIKGGRNA